MRYMQQSFYFDAFNIRLEGDYGARPTITREQAMELIDDQARGFLRAARRFLGVPEERMKS